MDDKKLHKDAQALPDALRDARTRCATRPRAPSRKKRKGGLGKLLLIAVIGGAVAMAASEGLRNKVLDALFGAEEEFDYTSTTAPAPPPDAPAELARLSAVDAGRPAGRPSSLRGATARAVCGPRSKTSPWVNAMWFERLRRATSVSNAWREPW